MTGVLDHLDPAANANGLYRLRLTATDISGRLRANLPAVAVGALGIGFLLAGGVGATASLISRRSREGETKASLGRFRLVDRD